MIMLTSAMRRGLVITKLPVVLMTHPDMMVRVMLMQCAALPQWLTVM